MSGRSSDEVSLSGYLYKKTRDGRWQKRWFETSGVYLTYYKSKKMEKLLAALSLPQVGGIRIISADEDPEKIEGKRRICFSWVRINYIHYFKKLVPSYLYKLVIIPILLSLSDVNNDESIVFLFCHHNLVHACLLLNFWSSIYCLFLQFVCLVIL